MTVPDGPPLVPGPAPSLAPPGVVEGGPLVVGLQPVALIDHAARVETAFVDSIAGEKGGSIRVTPHELTQLLERVRSSMSSLTGDELRIRMLAGGSVANTLRGLASGFGVPAAMLGAAGNDSLGNMFAKSMEAVGVQLQSLRRKAGATGQCVCLVDDEGNRTMRPCMQDAVRLQASELTSRDFAGAKAGQPLRETDTASVLWLATNAYALYGPGLLERSVELAKGAGASVYLDFASFEVVRAFKPQLLALLQSGQVDLCFANEDEARELVRGLDAEARACDAEAAVDVLAQWCDTVVVMLGPRGCIACIKGQQKVRVPALRDARALDTTGAGDLFASGFVYGLLHGLPLADCCRLGCSAGGAVIQELGGAVGAHGWAWMRQHWPTLLSQQAMDTLRRDGELK